MTNWLRPLTPVVLLTAIAWLSAGAGSCSQQQAPDLIQVREVAPADVELGDRIAISGDGFPAGKTARVTFRGELRRPGARPVRDAEIVLDASVVGPDRVEIPFGEATQALFCGAADRAAHTTFEGEVEVAFASAAAGSPPVAGALRQVVLDVRPSAAARDQELDREGERVLAFLGLQAGAARRGLGLPVEGVAPGSRAETAGIVAGDVLATFDGLRVASVGDLVPAPGEREASVGVRRVDSAVIVPRTLSVEGFQRPLATELLASALLVLGAVAVALLFGSPLRPSVASRLQQISARMRATASSRASGRDATWSRTLLALALRDALPPAAASGIVDVATCALLAAMPFGQYLVAARLDVGLLFVTAATALAAAAFAASRSAWSGARAVVHVAGQHLPAAIAVAGVVVTTGSLRIQEIERAQGGWPWDWLAFRSPAAFVGLLLLLGCALIDPDASAPATGIAGRADDLDPHGQPPVRGWLHAACRAHRIVIAALASALFLGGWSLPGLSPVQQDARPALELAGAAWWLTKTGGIVLGLACVRLGLPRGRLIERTRATLVWFAPLSLAALAAMAAWTWWSPGHSTQLLVSGALVTLATLAAAAVLQRIAHGAVAAGTEGHLSPFL